MQEKFRIYYFSKSFFIGLTENFFPLILGPVNQMVPIGNAIVSITLFRLLLLYRFTALVYCRVAICLKMFTILIRRRSSRIESYSRPTAVSD